MPEPGATRVSQGFAVVVHDVSPTFMPQLVQIVEALAPRVGGALAGAVVPCWHGRPMEGPESEFCRFAARAFGEVLQHGYTHRQERPGVVSMFTGRSDELAGLPCEELRRRLERGRALLRQGLGIEPAGFAPPAWRMGRATVEELGRSGFRYLTTFGAIRGVSGPTIPLTTWSWDWGILGPLGRIGRCFGDVASRLRPTSLPCVVVHPADVDRGYLPCVLEVVDRLQAQGRRPGLLSEFLR